MANRRRRRESTPNKSDNSGDQPSMKKEKKDVKQYLRDDETGELIPLTKNGRPDMRCNNARKYVQKLSANNSSINLSQNSNNSFNDSIFDTKAHLLQDGNNSSNLSSSSINQSTTEKNSGSSNNNSRLLRLNNSTPAVSSTFPSTSASSSSSLCKKPLPVLGFQHNVSKIDVFPQSITKLVNEKSKRREQQQQQQNQNEVQPSQEPTTTRNAISTQTETPETPTSQTTSTLIQTEAVEPLTNQTTSVFIQTETVEPMSRQTASTSILIQTDDLTLCQQETAGVQTDPGPKMTHVETQYQGRTHSLVSTQTVSNVFTIATQTQTPTFTMDSELTDNENNCCIV